MDIAALGLDEAAIARKVRLLQLSNLCSASTTLPFAEISAALGVSVDDVEAWMIDIIRCGLVEARVDQVNARVIVNRSAAAEFDGTQWALLRDKLSQWKQSIGQCTEVLSSVKAEIEGGGVRVGR